MITLGLDLGQQQDPTALALVERIERRTAYMPTQYLGLQVRYLERLPLGTPYTQVVDRVASILHRLPQPTRLIVDATGVGRPVVELLRRAKLPGAITSVTITGGDAVSGQGQEWRVPKQDLLAGVLILLEQGQLKISTRLKETETLVRELCEIQLTHKDSGHLQIAGKHHDDLALALALACWRPYNQTIGFVGQRLIGI